jgi:hypothetical protein
MGHAGAHLWQPCGRLCCRRCQPRTTTASQQVDWTHRALQPRPTHQNSVQMRDYIRASTIGRAQLVAQALAQACHAMQAGETITWYAVGTAAGQQLAWGWARRPETGAASAAAAAAAAVDNRHRSGAKIVLECSVKGRHPGPKARLPTEPTVSPRTGAARSTCATGRGLTAARPPRAPKAPHSSPSRSEPSIASA